MLKSSIFARVQLGKIAGSAVSGALMGATATATGGMSLLAQGGALGLAGMVAGQAEAATDAAVDQVLAGEGLGGDRFWERAQENGLGNPSKMVSDAVVGSASGLVTGALDKVLGAVASTGDITFRSEVTTIRGLVPVPGKPGQTGILLDPGRSVTLPGNPIGNWARGFSSSLTYKFANEFLGNWLNDRLEPAWESLTE